jgi:hypothetical protein
MGENEAAELLSEAANVRQGARANRSATSRMRCYLLHQMSIIQLELTEEAEITLGTSPKISLSATGLTEVSALNNECRAR